MLVRLEPLGASGNSWISVSGSEDMAMARISLLFALIRALLTKRFQLAIKNVALRQRIIALWRPIVLHENRLHRVLGNDVCHYNE